jgi:hypothetical protein
MFSRRVAIAALLLLVPVVAEAQRKVRGDKEADWKAIDKDVEKNQTGLKLGNKDVENMSPVKLLVDKRKDLKLTDDQLKQLKTQDEKLKESTKPLYKSLDSLRNVMRPTPNPNDDDRARALSARLGVADLMSVFAANYQVAATEATAVLDDTQKAKATELFAQLKTESEEVLKEKLGAGGGRGR